MLVPVETVILVSGVAALAFAAVTIQSLNKIKDDCSGSAPKWDSKKYDTARNLQIAQLVLSGLVVALSGWVLASSLSKRKLPGADRIRQFMRESTLA